GLRRKGFAAETIRSMDRALKTIFLSDERREVALASVEREWGAVEEIRRIVDFIRSSERGVSPLRPGTVEPE
ncbi:MAG: acyl-[acyl-carrier-protein]--UDP-N-acetylglucosamine O-acyltransferase, partial [Acidobacteriota bacterium]|nr:acyl-[acyl-carrier-protein]--UDP-N-acetylglucosamine O-acyltransferase [Acidobacteriota bacterium]